MLGALGAQGLPASSRRTPAAGSGSTWSSCGPLPPTWGCANGPSPPPGWLGLPRREEDIADFVAVRAAGTNRYQFRFTADDLEEQIRRLYDVAVRHGRAARAREAREAAEGAVRRARRRAKMRKAFRGDNADGAAPGSDAESDGGDGRGGLWQRPGTERRAHRFSRFCDCPGGCEFYRETYLATKVCSEKGHRLLGGRAKLGEWAGFGPCTVCRLSHDTFDTPEVSEDSDTDSAGAGDEPPVGRRPGDRRRSSAEVGGQRGCGNRKLLRRCTVQGGEVSDYSDGDLPNRGIVAQRHYFDSWDRSSAAKALQPLLLNPEPPTPALLLYPELLAPPDPGCYLSAGFPFPSL